MLPILKIYALLFSSTIKYRIQVAIMVFNLVGVEIMARVHDLHATSTISILL